MAFENILETAMNFIKATGEELIETAKDSFDALKEVKKVLQDVQENLLEDPIIKNACILVLFKGFIAQLCFAAAVSKTVQEIDPLESQLPPSLQPKAAVIRNYLDSIREKLKEILATVNEMKTIIKESKPRRYKLTEEEKKELKSLMRDLKSDLQTVSDYQNYTEKALNSLWWDNVTYTAKEGAVAVGTSLAAGAAAGAIGSLVGGYAVGRLTDTKGLVEKSQVYFGTAIGSLYGVINATEQLKVINGKYNEHLKIINGLQAELDCLTPKIEEKVRKVDNMAETMKEHEVYGD